MDRQPASLRDDGVCGICSAARAWAKGGSSIGLSYVTHVAQWLGGDITLTLIYRASSHGSTYGHLLHCVGDRRGLVFVIRKKTYVFGCCISGGLQPPDDPTDSYHYYRCDVWWFSLAGHFKRPTKIDISPQWQLLVVAGREGAASGASVRIGGHLWLGCGSSGSGGGPAADIRRCSQLTVPQWVPEGYQGVRDGRGSVYLGGTFDFVADEVEVLCVQ